MCGPCFAGSLDVATGTMRTESWSTVKVTTEPTSIGGSCERRTALPTVPTGSTSPFIRRSPTPWPASLARTASQSFELPLPGDVVDVELGVSP